MYSRLLLTLLLVTGVGAHAAELTIECNARVARLEMPAAGQSLVLVAERVGVLTVAESGQEVVLSGGDVHVIESPPRLGQHVLVDAARVRIDRLRPGSARGSIDARLACAESDAATKARIEWLDAVHAVETGAAGTGPIEPLLDALAALEVSAAHAADAALVKHVRAQVLLIRGRSADAAEAFAVAERAWLENGDAHRALAARVARAEDLHRTARYADVIAITRDASGLLPDRNRYFGIRLENARCLALQYLGRLEESSQCFAGTAAALEESGETLELISTLLDSGQVQRDRGAFHSAETLARNAFVRVSQVEWNAVEGPDVSMVRGRARRLLADVALRRGSISEALHESHAALEDFARAKASRWEGNTLLRIAAIYRELGALDDAAAAVSAASARFNPRDAPARIAAASLAAGEIALAASRHEDAVAFAVDAAQRSASIAATSEWAAAVLLRAEAEAAGGDRTAARRTLATIRDAPPALAPRIDLLVAEIDIAEGSNKGPRIAASEWTSLGDWLRHETTSARIGAMLGDHDAASAGLLSATRRLEQLAHDAGNPLLRLALLRKRRVLRDVALEIELRRGGAEPDARKILSWVLATQSFEPAHAARASGSIAANHDRLLADALLPATPTSPRDPDVEESAIRALVALLSTRFEDGGETEERSLTSEDVLASLDEGDALLVVLATQPRPLILLATRDGARVVGSGLDTATLERHARNLRAAVVDVSTPVGALETDIVPLSGVLLAGLNGRPAPRRLLIHADAPLQSLPWLLLRVPGREVPLVEFTAVSLVSLRRSEEPRTTEGPPTLQVVAIERVGDGSAPLAPLAGASVERSLVESAVAGTAVRVRAVSPHRDAVLGVLADEGSWVHVAAHGTSDPNRIGRAGIWMTRADAPDRIDLLSWLDIVALPVRAQLVVLNACSLAATPDGSAHAGIGFADALVHGGAQDVVAAGWSVSDAAATLWIPGFYRRLATENDRGGVARAVRDAALRLRATRAYRHPAYWASLVHVTSLHVGPSRAP